MLVNIGMGPVASQGGADSMTVNVGLELPQTMGLVIPQQGWGLPLSSEQSVSVVVGHSQAIGYLDVNVIEAPAP